MKGSKAKMLRLLIIVLFVFTTILPSITGYEKEPVESINSNGQKVSIIPCSFEEVIQLNHTDEYMLLSLINKHNYDKTCADSVWEGSNNEVNINNTLIVDNEGNGDFTSIQNAIDAANNGYCPNLEYLMKN